MNPLRHLTRTHCDVCAKAIVAAGSGSGYAIVPKPNTDGMTYCYDCADELARAELATARYGQRHTFYVSSDGTRLTTWSGGDLARVVMGKPHPFSDERRYLTVIGRDGRHWHGTGAAGMWATITLDRRQP